MQFYIDQEKNIRVLMNTLKGKKSKFESPPLQYQKTQYTDNETFNFKISAYCVWFSVKNFRTL
ncbi:hypothetical protein AD998_20385 [bacterium 336/3]|nr:hypothetical protein AD998_20385 [bacterium 336/3]